MFHEFKLLGTEAGLDFDIKLDPGRRFYSVPDVVFDGLPALYGQPTLIHAFRDYWRDLLGLAPASPVNTGV